jgi:hypothetical protein
MYSPKLPRKFSGVVIRGEKERIRGSCRLLISNLEVVNVRDMGINSQLLSISEIL